MWLPDHRNNIYKHLSLSLSSLLLLCWFCAQHSHIMPINMRTRARKFLNSWHRLRTRRPTQVHYKLYVPAGTCCAHAFIPLPPRPIPFGLVRSLCMLDWMQWVPQMPRHAGSKTRWVGWWINSDHSYWSNVKWYLQLKLADFLNNCRYWHCRVAI